MKIKVIVLVVIFALAFHPSLLAQSDAVNRDSYTLRIVETDEKVTIDGYLNETIWKTAGKTGKFARILPIDTGFASAQTVVMMAYDKSNLYLAAVCYDTLPGKRPVESLRRDFSFGKNDNFIAFIDSNSVSFVSR